MPQGTVIYNKHGKTNIKIIIALNNDNRQWWWCYIFSFKWSNRLKHITIFVREWSKFSQTNFQLKLEVTIEMFNEIYEVRYQNTETKKKPCDAIRGMG